MKIRINKKSEQKKWYDSLDGKEIDFMEVTEKGDFIVEENLSGDGILLTKIIKKEDAVVSKYNLEYGWYLLHCEKCNTNILSELSEYISDEEITNFHFCDCGKELKVTPPIEMDASTICDIISNDFETVNRHSMQDVPSNIYNAIKKIVKDDEKLNKIFRVFYYEDSFQTRSSMTWRTNKFIKTVLYED